MKQSFALYKGRSVKAGQKVEVYYNLHQSGFTIKSIDPGYQYKGKVVAHAVNVHLAECQFVVSKSGINKVREKRVKRVCATVRGTLISTGPIDSSNYEAVYFNPYQTEEFVWLDTKKPISKASHVYFYDRFCAAEKELRLL